MWADTTVLSGDVAAAIRELKAKPGGELQVHGSGALTRWLLDSQLVDEINLLIVPVNRADVREAATWATARSWCRRSLQGVTARFGLDVRRRTPTP